MNIKYICWNLLKELWINQCYLSDTLFRFLRCFLQYFKSGFKTLVGFRIISDPYPSVFAWTWFPLNILSDPFFSGMEISWTTSDLSFSLILHIIYLSVSTELPDWLRLITSVKLYWKNQCYYITLFFIEYFLWYFKLLFLPSDDNQIKSESVEHIIPMYFWKLF